MIHILCEAYKCLPKDKKSLIDVLVYAPDKEISEIKTEEALDYGKMCDSMDNFIYDAYSAAFIRRKKRSYEKRNWRSIVTNFLKEALNISNDDKYSLYMRQLGIRLIVLLYYAITHYVFSYNSDTEAIDQVSIDVSETFRTLCKQYIAESDDKIDAYEYIESAVKKINDNYYGKSRYNDLLKEISTTYLK